MFYVTGNLCTSTGSCWKKQSTLPHGGASQTFREGKRGRWSPEADSRSPAGVSQGAALTHQAAGGSRAVAASAPELFSAVGSGWCLAALGQERQSSSGAECPDTVRRGVNGLWRLASDESGFGEAGPGGSEAAVKASA